MLPANRSKLGMFSDKQLCYLSEEISGGYHIYFLSDEEIKVGDWCVDKNNCIYKQETDKIFQTFNNSNKIIATTDKSLCRKVWKHTNKKSKPYNIQSNIETTRLISVSFPRPSPEFVEVFIREYNKGNVIQNVMVEYDAYNRSTTWEYDKPEIIKLKVDKNNYITITREKESWSREEVINLCRKIQDETAKYKRSCHYGPNLRELNEWTDDWIEQNL